MSDNSTNTVIENEMENVVSEDGVDESTLEIVEDNVDTSADPIYEQAEAQQEAPKKKLSFKDILIFAQNKIFTPKVCNIVLISLGSLITALCLMQIVFWGLSIKDTYLNYWEAIKIFDFINITIMAFMVLFVLVLFVNTIKSIISLIKKGYEPHFETVSTLFAFCIFSMFVTRLFGGTTLLISNFEFEPLLNIIVILVLLYAFVRLFVKDFGARICPLAFSCGAIVLCIIMFTQDIGNFATFTIDDAQKFQLADLNIYRYIQAVITPSNADIASSLDLTFFEYGATISINGIDLDEEILVIMLQFVPIMVSNVLPYVAISLLGYLMFGLVGRNYMQYYNLQTCKKISITMLVVTILSLAATIGLHFACKLTNAHLAVQLDYANIIVTVILCIVMIVVTSLPWKIYNIIYKHRYAAYQKSEGGN